MPQAGRNPQLPFAPPLVAAALVCALVGTLGGCEAQRSLAGYPAPQSAAADAAPWPRLVDGPTHAVPPGPGPDPAAGAAVAAGLTAEAREMAARAEALGAPVVPVSALRAEAAAARAGRPAP